MIGPSVPLWALVFGCMAFFAFGVLSGWTDRSDKRERARAFQFLDNQSELGSRLITPLKLEFGYSDEEALSVFREWTKARAK